MNKPPEPANLLIFDHWMNKYRGSTETEKQMYEDMKRPMTQKTENLTTEEAWTAMARGECVKAWDYAHRINENVLEFFNREKWLAVCELSEGPYSIVPDPSKPKEVEDQYEKDWECMTDEYNLHHDIRDNLKFILEKYFQRKL